MTELSEFERKHLETGGRLLVVEEDINQRWQIYDVSENGNMQQFNDDGFSTAEDANNLAYGLAVLSDKPAFVRSESAAEQWIMSEDYY